MEKTREEDVEEIFAVVGPAGGVYEVQTVEEVDHYNRIMNEYLTDNSFKNISDRQELERLLQLELFCWRRGNWLLADKDYLGGVIDPQEIQKSVKDYSVEIRLIKAALGVDKSTREKDKGSSTAEYIDNLWRRAKEFGYLREDQLQKALILFNELRALITLWQNTDELEQREMHCSQRDIFDWIVTICIPEFEEIDRYFKMNQQRMWIKTL